MWKDFYFQAWCLQFSTHLGRSFLLLQSDSPEIPVLGHDFQSTAVQLPQNGVSMEQQCLEQSLQMDVDEVSGITLPKQFL